MGEWSMSQFRRRAGRFAQLNPARTTNRRVALNTAQLEHLNMFIVRGAKLEGLCTIHLRRYAGIGSSTISKLTSSAQSNNPARSQTQDTRLLKANEIEHQVAFDTFAAGRGSMKRVEIKRPDAVNAFDRFVSATLRPGPTKGSFQVPHSVATSERALYRAYSAFANGISVVPISRTAFQRLCVDRVRLRYSEVPET